jgi:DNA-binding response OmpR family regulator
MRRILVIDDDQAVRGAITIVLEADGFEVVTAEDGFAGLELAKASKFDLVIVDLFMPRLGGLDTIRQLRERNSALPIIAMSGSTPRRSTDPADLLESATQLGDIIKMPKPFRATDLLKTVHSAVGKSAG